MFKITKKWFIMSTRGCLMLRMQKRLQVGNISGLLKTISPLGPVKSQNPLTFEEMKQVWCLSEVNNRGGTSLVVTVNFLKHGEFPDCCFYNLSCLLCSVLWIHAVSDHAAPEPLRAHATYLSTEWGS